MKTNTEPINGNALPHVEDRDVRKTLEQMDSLVKEGGWLYLDTRNWDKILKERNRFFLAEKRKR